MRTLFLFLLLLLPAWGQAVPTKPVPETIQRVSVKSFRITGNTFIPTDQLKAAVQPYEGRDLSLDEMKEAAAAVTALYHADGHLLVRALIPPQDYRDGVVDMLVLEGKIGAVTVEGNEYYSTEFITSHFDAGDIIDMENFQRALLLLNEYPDLKVQAVLKAGSTPGTADVTLKVKDSRPLHGVIDYNNFGSLGTGVNKAGLTVEAANLIGGDKLTVRGVAGFPSVHNNFFMANYIVPVDTDGTKVGVAYSSGAYIVGRELEVLDLRGNADIYTVSVSRALTRTLTRSTDIWLNLSHNDVRNSILGEPFNRDRYNAIRLGYSMDLRDLDGRTFLRAVVSRGVGGLEDVTTVSRLGAEGDFTKLNLDAARVQTLAPGFYAVMRGSAQLSRDPLISAEGFVVGGPDSVRGYQQGELLGDAGYIVSFELRKSLVGDDFQVVGFFDHGTVVKYLAILDDYDRRSLTGAGFGFRIVPWKNANLRVDVGFPVTPAQSSSRLNPAVYTQFSTRF